MAALELEEYLNSQGKSPFEEWTADLDRVTRVRIITALGRLAEGNISQIKSVGDGVMEMRLAFGPGYRVYLGRDGARLVILLCGGTKAQQQRDINRAK